MEVQSQDPEKTGTGLDCNRSGPEISKTDKDRNRGQSSVFEIFKNLKTDIRPVFSVDFRYDLSGNTLQVLILKMFRSK